MAVLVRDVTDFMTPAELALPEAEGIKAYNARLAQIYLDEVPIGGVPMNMEGFRLFAPGRRSSLPLCLSYEASKIACPEKARVFLMRLREATVLECRPTTERGELLRVVRLCGINENEFLRRLDDGSAAAALRRDSLLARLVGIESLPSFLLECGARSALLCGVPDFDTLARAIGMIATP